MFQGTGISFHIHPGDCHQKCIFGIIYHDDDPSYSVHSPSYYGTNTIHHYRRKAAPASRMMQDYSANDEAISNSEQDIQQVKSPITYH